MSRRKQVPLPTDGELEILDVLWQDGPSTVRQIHAQLEQRRAIGYTSVLKLLQIMHQKGLVQRDESTRTHVYETAFVRSETQGRLVSDLMTRAFGGSAGELVLRALGERRASEAELQEIRSLLDRLERAP